MANRRSPKHFVAAAAISALGMGASLCGTASPASAWQDLIASAPACNTVKLQNPNGMQHYFGMDDGTERLVEPHTSITIKVPAGGDYYYRQGPADPNYSDKTGLLSVRRCPGTSQRPIDGDESGDGKADVLGIQAKTGDLYYYRMTQTGLARGIKAGTGWHNMVFMQRVNEIQGPGTGNYMIAIRNDGTVWRYANKGQGRLGSGQQIGSGMRGFTGFSITSLNGSWLGTHELIAIRDGRLHSAPIRKNSIEHLSPIYDYGGEWPGQKRNLALRNFDNVGDGDVLSLDAVGNFWFHPAANSDGAAFLPARRIGHGWNQMGIVASPGSFNGDRLNDLIARRNDGNLYKYLNQGGKWGPAVKIGSKWNGIRLLA